MSKNEKLKIKMSKKNIIMKFLTFAKLKFAK